LEIVDFVIFLPKREFYDFNLNKILDFLRKESSINYKIIGLDRVALSLSANIYTCDLNVEEAIKKSIYGKCLFIPGGKGTLEITNNYLAMSYLNAYNPLDNILILEREALFIFVELKKLFSYSVSKLYNLDDEFFYENQLIPIDEDIVIDNNAITSRRAISDLWRFVIKCLKDFG
jgi:hypothetical protein